jgi:pyruvate dehydrogenase E1 component
MYGPRRDDVDPDVFYYLTVYNEPKVQPAAPDDVADLDEKIVRGLYRCAPAPEVPGNGEAPRAQLLASGTAMHWAIEAQQLLAQDWGVAADLWSATSWTELRREALRCDADNRRLGAAAEGERRVPFVTQQLEGSPGPVVAVSDWMRAVPDQIAQWVPGEWSSLGTDGYGRSDTRPALRRHFQVDAPSIVLATLIELARRNEVKVDAPQQAIEKYGL